MGEWHACPTTHKDYAPKTERLESDLFRAGIQPFAWFINQFLPASDTTAPLLAQRGAFEVPFIRRIADE